jgi:2,5-furandicarboxylate decarboxylase 1
MTRIQEEKRVDELPMLMEQYPDCAILVEKVKNSPFPFLSGAYGTREMYAVSLGCKSHELEAEVAKRLEQRHKPKVVHSAPCKDVIIKGGDIDLTLFPPFCHHQRDGQASLNDANVITRDWVWVCMTAVFTG